jgi:serine/threonine protein kinase
VARQPLPKDTELRGRYRVDTVLGAGGFGITYVGQDLHLNRAVAIKEYFPADHAQREGHYSVRSLDSGNRQFFALGRTWFLREARTLAKYHHPNIVGVMDHFEENSTAYMILRFEEGQSLSRWLRSLGRPPNQYEVDSFMLPILSALETMHKNNDMHRDVAMDNIILRPTGDPVLIDFGSARQAIGAHSRSIDAVVKFGYSPPEQYSVDPRLQGPWSDVYALASTLHLAVTGKLPPDAPGRQLDDNYERLAESGLEGYRIGLLEGIDWGLALRPAERPQSISEWRRTLMKSTNDPLGEDPVELIAAHATQGQSSLRTPSPPNGASQQGVTSAAGTVFVSPTQAVRSGPRGATGRSAAALTSGRVASGGVAVPSNTGPPSLSRHPSQRKAQGQSQHAPGPDAAAAHGAGQNDHERISDGGAARPAGWDSALRSRYADGALLGLAAIFAGLFFQVSAGDQASGGTVVFSRLQTGFVAGYGLSLAALIGRNLALHDPWSARPRAMLALGLFWLPTVLLSVLAIPFLGLAYTMRAVDKPWHATALNIAGGLHVLTGVALILVAVKDSPMFVLSISLTLIGLGFLTILTTRVSQDSNS